MRVSSNNNMSSIRLEMKTGFIFLQKDNATNSFTAAEPQFAPPSYSGSTFPVIAFELGLH